MTSTSVALLSSYYQRKRKIEADAGVFANYHLLSAYAPSAEENITVATSREEIKSLKEEYLHCRKMLFLCSSIMVIISSLASTIIATICYECSNPMDLSTCSLINSEKFGNLGCLIEFEDPDDIGLRVRRITKFCPSNFTECSNLMEEKNTWLTLVWKMHNSNTKQLRKNPILSMWYECFGDKCNSPEYVESLMSINVSWNTQLLAMKSAKATSSTQCYTCSNQTIPFVCTGLGICENGCKMQGYRIGTNPVASRLLTIFDVRYWQPQCNHDLKEYQSSAYSLNGYVINNLNDKNRNVAIEAYCSRDECNRLDTISKFMNNISIVFQSEPWFSTGIGTKQTVLSIFVHAISILTIAQRFLV